MGNGSSSSSSSASAASRHSAYPGNRGGGGQQGGAGGGGSSVPPHHAGAQRRTQTAMPAQHTVVQGSRIGGGGAGRGGGGQRQRRSYTTTTTTTHIPSNTSSSAAVTSSSTTSSLDSSTGGASSTAFLPPAPNSTHPAPPSLAGTIDTSPGAYSISRSAPGAGPTQVFRVNIPPSVRPNQEFQVYAGTRVVRVRCPPDVRPGQSLQITVPPEPVVRRVGGPGGALDGVAAGGGVGGGGLGGSVGGGGGGADDQAGQATLTSVTGDEGGGAFRMNAEVERVNRTVLEAEEATRLARLSLRSRANLGRSEVGGPQDEDEDDGDAAEDDDGEASGGGRPQQQQQQTPQPPPPQPQPQPQPQAYMVTVPPGVRPGSNFRVLVEGTELMVQCPPTAGPGTQVRIVPPRPEPAPSAPAPETPPHRPQQQQQQSSSNGGGGIPPVEGITPASSLDRPPDEQLLRPHQQRPQLQTQMFEVVVPPLVGPNQPFALMAGGQRVLVTCPPGAVPGQKIRFALPVTNPSTKSIESVKLTYADKDGWTRTVRVTDMKFQWVRMDDKGEIDMNSRFDVARSAYVRRLVFLEGNDPRMGAGILGLVPASEAAVEAKVVVNGREIVGYADIVNAQSKTFEEKALWFQDTVGRLTVDWNEGHMRINVRRQALLTDSMGAVMSLSPHDLRKMWRFEFLGESGVDAGGLAREWFHLVTQQIFDADSGLWLSTSNNQMSMRINPASGISCPEDHLVYFRFLGRVMGKAMFDRQLVAGHMVRHMYKHILGWPITFEDLELVDEETYKSLKGLLEMDPDQIEYLCLDFTTTEETLGVKKDVELIPDGADVDVTKDNLPEYLEARLKYSMLDRTKPQMTELLLGFFDVIPEPLLTVFDFQELELLMCGMPTIDVDDWAANTIYTGAYEGTKGAHRACKWFWEVVRDDFDQEMRARLLQFVTGTSGVPSRGFSVLQGNDGNIKKFAIHGVDPKAFHYPRAHTCFNRIDLPTYNSKKDLLEKLKIAVSTSATGFDIE